MACGSFDEADILTLVLVMAWACLSCTPANQKNALLAVLFASQSVFNEVASLVSIEFTPGLWEILQSGTPPTLRQFKTFRGGPKRTDRLWAVYLRVLEKSLHRPKIYIGSGTEAKTGVHSRLKNYERHDNTVSELVDKALKEGYQITHIGLICWIPIPSVVLQPKIRMLFVILEAAFSYVFWAMRPGKKENDYGMGWMCPWDRSLEYDGCCTHCSLYEMVSGDFQLSDEQLEAAAAQRRANTRLTNKNSEANIRKAKTYFCKLCKVSLVSQYRLGQHNETASHKRKAKDLTDPKKPHVCYVCNRSFATITKLNRHNAPDRHRAALSSPELD